ncbi:PAS domain S-box protein [Gemmatimonadota bacterium]
MENPDRKTLTGIDLDDIAGVGEILSLLLENTPDAIYLLVGQRFPLINTGFQEMFGVTLEEANSPDFNFMDMVAPGSRPIVIERAERYARGEQVDPEYEFKALTKDGQELYVRTNTARITFRGDDATLGIIRDITTQKQIELSLRESEEKYRVLVERAADGIAIIQEGRLVFINQRVAGMLGYTVEELIDTEIMGYIHPDVREVTMDRYRRRMAGESVPAVYESKFLRKDGSATHAEVNAGLITYQDRIADLIIVRDINDRLAAEEALQSSEHSLRTLFETMIEGVIWVTPDGSVKRANRAAEEILGIGQSEDAASDYTMPEWNLLSEDGSDLSHENAPWIVALRENRSVRDTIVGLQTPDNSVTWIMVTITLIHDEEGAPVSAVATFSDITERRILEQQLMQAQKMEAIGRLAGGVAHDFNNILTVISGNAQLGMMALRENDPMRERLATIQKSAGHAEELTRQLLAFGRKQISSPRVVNINEILTGLEKMLHRVIGEDIDLNIQPDSSISSIYFDPTQMEQIFMNLVVNSRDAMPNGGSLTITTENVQLGEDYIKTHPYLTVGPYVLVSISDTGTGMDEETRRQVFEPFFTTKEQGSGLGLATVYGIVKQSKGAIEVESAWDSGTAIRIHLPVHEGPAKTFTPAIKSTDLMRGHENILLVEDEDGVRAFAAETLTELGYRVSDFSTPAKAWEFCKNGKREIDLILTDVIMPGESGAELAERLRPLYPKVPVLFMSGHTDDFIVHHGVLDESVLFIPKPFSPRDLSQKLRDILDDPKE